MSESHELVVIIRPSFKRFCGADACRAALFNHLLYWIARKAKGESAEKVKSGEVYWYGTAEEICEGIDQSWSVNKVRKEIKELVDAGLIGQRRNPKKGWDQTRHYFIGEDQGKAIRSACEKYDVCLSHLGLHPDVLHLLNLVNATTKNGKCNCQISEMDLPNMADAITKSGNAIPKDVTKVSSKDINKGKERELSPETPSFPLSENGSSFAEVYNAQSYTVKPAKMTSKVVEQFEKLAKLIHSEEHLLSLFELAREQNVGKSDPTVYLGNLVRALPAWKQQQMKPQPWYGTPEPGEAKPDAWIDGLAVQRAEEWDEVESVEEYKREMKAVYQRARCDEADFRRREEEVTQATNYPGKMMIDDAIGLGYESVLAYYTEALCREFGVQQESST